MLKIFRFDVRVIESSTRSREKLWYGVGRSGGALRRTSFANNSTVPEKIKGLSLTGKQGG